MSAPMQEEPPGGDGGGGENVLTRKVGAFPTWVWMGLGLALLLAFANWKKQKTPAATTPSTAGGSTVDASLIPQFVNQVYSNPSPPVVNITNNNDDDDKSGANKGGEDNDKDDRKPPPGHVPGPVQPPPGRNPGGPPPVQPPGGGGSGGKPPNGQWVTAGVWTSTNAPWNSTLWGIAQHTYGNGALYNKIFLANKKGVMRPDGTAGFITDPAVIHPGDRIFVPA